MRKSKSGRALYKVALLTSVTALAAFGCNRGNTDGGAGNDDAGTGVQLVSDGGFGASLKIDAPDDIAITQIEGFRVTMRDPAGQPLAFIRVFCESEQGIAIIEPSRNGVAFESTGADGQFSGALGGLSPGSYLFECRAEEGFNLVDRVTIVVRGDVPPGFDGFPGAAGGNLGGGRFVEDPGEPGDGTPSITSISFSSVGEPGADELAEIDTVFNPNCDGDATTVDPEPFGSDRVTITIRNPLTEPVNVGALVFRPGDGSGATSFIAPSGTRIEAGQSRTYSAFLTEIGAGTTLANGLVVGSKRWAGTGVQVIDGTFGISFTTTLTGADSGSVINLTDGASAQAAGFDFCGG